MCPLHGAQFDVTTGRPAGSPANGPVTSYAIKVEGDDILVDI
jgi:3-phenylpropionate/trans-cinnamate dioxygenase ferredoxin subunit